MTEDFGLWDKWVSLPFAAKDRIKKGRSKGREWIEWQIEEEFEDAMDSIAESLMNEPMER